MADGNSTLEPPRGLNLRNKKWWIERSIEGRRVRMSTGCTDLKNAIEVFRRIEGAHAAKNASLWWNEQVALAGAGKKSWLLQALGVAMSRAKSREREFNLTRDFVVALAAASEGRCAVSGIQFNDRRVGPRRPFYPSLDRIDCAQGYTVTNTRLVCVIVNYAMSDFGEEALRLVARAIVARELISHIHATDLSTTPLSG